LEIESEAVHEASGELEEGKTLFAPGLPEFSWCMKPKQEKMYQMNKQCIKWSLNIPNVHKMSQMAINYLYQHFPIRDPDNFSQIGIFGLKTNHLATLVCTKKETCHAVSHDAMRHR
jgi:hypothetical protein